jgi:hypothetical protein
VVIERFNGADIDLRFEACRAASPGEVFLTAWDDYTVRLHDLRSPRPYEFSYRDATDPMAPILTCDLRLVGSVSKEPIPIFRYAEIPSGEIFEIRHRPYKPQIAGQYRRH